MNFESNYTTLKKTVTHDYGKIGVTEVRQIHGFKQEGDIVFKNSFNIIVWNTSLTCILCSRKEKHEEFLSGLSSSPVQTHDRLLGRLYTAEAYFFFSQSLRPKCAQHEVTDTENQSYNTKSCPVVYVLLIKDLFFVPFNVSVEVQKSALKYLGCYTTLVPAKREL